MKTISVIVPFYNEELMVHKFTIDLFQTIDKISNYSFDVLFINDGSSDSTLELLGKEAKVHSNIRIISFSRNFGHEAAINAGVDYCIGDAAIVMDADLQDPPTHIPELIKKFEEGYDVVNVRRIDRSSDAFSKRITAKIFYWLISHWSYKVKIVDNVNNFRLISKRIIDVVKNLSGRNKVFRFEVPFAGFKTTNIELIRPKRVGGKSHYNLSSMSRLAIDSIVSVSTQPLNLITKLFIILSFAFCATSITELILFIIQKTTGTLFVSDIGYLIWLIINVCLLFTLFILFGLAVIAQYVARIHIETQNRPIYVVEKIISSKKD